MPNQAELVVEVHPAVIGTDADGYYPGARGGDIGTCPSARIHQCSCVFPKVTNHNLIATMSQYMRFRAFVRGTDTSVLATLRFGEVRVYNCSALLVILCLQAKTGSVGEVWSSAAHPGLLFMTLEVRTH